jgi:hypothetical protein
LGHLGDLRIWESGSLRTMKILFLS